METVSECPVCGSNEFSPFVHCKDYLVSQEEFAIQQCNQCSFRLTNPRPASTELGAYYQSEQYVSHNDSSAGLVNSVYRMVRQYTLQSKVKLINELNGKAGRLLDIGCGTGEFLKTSQQRNWTVAGMEPDDQARSIASQKLGIDIKADLNAVDPSGQFDIISLWHVLEHIADLNVTIPLLRQRLAPNGTLLIAVPNSDSFDATFYGPHWAAYDVPRHLSHFTPTSIKPLFHKHGLQLIEKRPMPFDAFYIALLSSRYRTGHTNYLESVRVGFRSNWEARQTGNASSVLYLFRQ